MFQQTWLLSTVVATNDTEEAARRGEDRWPPLLFSAMTVVEAAAFLLLAALLFFLPFLFTAGDDSSPLDVFNDAVLVVLPEELLDDSSLEDVVEEGEVDLLSLLLVDLAAEK